MPSASLKNRPSTGKPPAAPDKLSPAQARKWLWVIVAFAFGYKLLSLSFILGNLQGYGLERMGWDSPTYYQPAMAMAHGAAFHSEVRTPGYPAFLALIYSLTGDPNPISNLNLLAIFLAQSALLSLGCIPIFYAVRHLTQSDRLALLGAFLWAVNNSARYYALMVLTEALTAFLLCLLVYALARAVRENRLIWHALLGGLMFLLTLIRPSVSLLAVPTGIGLLLNAWAIRKERNGKRFAAMAVLLLVLPLSCPTLWAWRNAAVEGKRYYCRLSMFGAYAFGVAIPAGMSEGKDPEAVHAAAWNEFFRLLDRMPPDTMDRMYKERMIADLKRHPTAVASYLVKSMAYFWLPTMNKPLGNYQYRDELKPAFWRKISPRDRTIYAFYLINSIVEFVALAAMTLMILSLFLPGGRPSLPSQQGFAFVSLLIFAYWLLVHSLSARYCGARFLFPLVPLIITAAAVGLSARRRTA